MTWNLVPATEFATHSQQWRQLNADTVRSPLLELEFIEPLLREFGTGKELLAWHETDGKPDVMAILTPNGRMGWATFQPSQAPIGLWLQRIGVDLDDVIGSLIRKLPGFPLMLALMQRDPALSARPADDGRLQTMDYIETSKVTLHGSFDDYWASRGKNLRSNMKKQRAKLLKEGINARMECSRDPAQMADALADYGRLESAGWKAEIGTAIHPDNAQGRFYLSMLEGFCRRGAATANRYWFDDRLVAMNLCIEGDGCMIILKTTYDESVSSQFSPAFLMLEETCQQLYAEQRFNRLEFYGKVMDWHRRWTDEVRTMYHVNRYRWSALLAMHTMMKNRASANVAQPASPQLALSADAKSPAE